MNTPPRRRLAAAAALAALSALAGCATQAPTRPPLRRPVWPPPPEQPRYIFEATLRGAASLVDESSESQMRRLLVGEDASAQTIGKPFAVAAARGRIYVTDTEGRRVFVFDIPRRRTFTFGFRLEGALKKPSGIDLDAQGRVYVVDTTARRVVIYDELGLYVGDIDGSAIWTRPTAVAVDAAGERIHVVDTGGVESDNHRVTVHDNKGRMVAEIGRRGSRPGEFNLPTDCAMGANGELWVLDAGNFRVQAFDAQGRALRQFGSPGNGLGQLARPRGLAVGRDGLVYVSDATLCNVQVFQPDGQLLLALGGRSAGDDAPGRYLLPARLATDETGRLYVVDQFLHKVEVLRRLSDEEGRRRMTQPPA
ncbi:6-bladed beta-propeller [Rubrivivax sp. A210]|uniref:6-bladed beta-propeller n=1 Tax=Rubrivivax sp. A210 TaxID=2772301 RepID=UPI001918F481|nr:6-bladed beta-propeller [Rubrivivax sp. A210]CAD5372320.1 6-bladed beta-propeller [Rubrivivax sp. A210]